MADSANAASAPPADARPWASDALAWLIEPTGQAEFFERYYERAPLIAAHEDPDRYKPLLSIPAIDRLIASADLRQGMVDLADASRELDRTAYQMEGGALDRAVLAHEYSKGATLIVQQLHQSDPNLAAFCRAMEQTFSCHVQTNIYLTPPGAQGFGTHYDNHDVFVLQVEGEKRWRLYNTPVDTPYRGEHFQRDRHDKGELTAEFVMKPGDCAYVPRGLMHDASSAGGGPSLHVTCGLIVKTWAELVLEAVSEAALHDPAFRRGLPPGFARPDYDRAEAEAIFLGLIGRLPKSASMTNAFQLMVDGFIRSREPDVAGAVLAGGAPLTAGQLWRLRPTAPWRLADDKGEVVVIVPGGDLTLRDGEIEAGRRALSGEPFRGADLGLDDPALLIRRLHAFGLIEPV